MKKRLCLLLVLVMVFALTACGEKDEQTKDKIEDITKETEILQPAEDDSQTLTR